MQLKQVIFQLSAGAIVIAFGAFCFAMGMTAAAAKPQAVQVMASFFGTLFAIFGAVGLWQIQQWHLHRRTGQAVVAICRSWFELINLTEDFTVLDMPSHPPDPERESQTYNGIVEIQETLKRFDVRWQNLSGRQMINYLDIEWSLATMRKSFEFAFKADTVLEQGNRFEEAKREAKAATHVLKKDLKRILEP